MQSAKQNLEPVEKYLQEEVAEHRIIGPLPLVMRQPPDIGERHSIFLVVVHVTAERHVC